MTTTPTPQSIDVLLESRVLELGYADGTVLALPFELLRVYSPSAEVMGHGPGQETLQTGKRGVEIVDLQTVGHYAIQPTFSDGHQSGIFTWDYLYRLGTQKDALWQEYLDRLAAAGKDRDQPMPGQQGGHSCGSGGCGGH
ncbi:DUF971 domain-containing protein [Comamonas denitrificans]|uniref:DUF971 domain-containing protein n=1 Tax=Comamonas denitrificans TaxID=117506 RepID=A0A939KDD9_9BURK|nr:DUF971 domain-containing protein [Comamonas denitrificans]MBO1249259.1 DUF971 domain-containing protein [Comamonas denitrificans]